VPENDRNIECYENTTLFLTSITQYLLVVIVFSVGKPFRKAMYTNYWLLGCMIIFGIITYLMILVPPAFVTNIMEFKDIPSKWRLVIVAFSAANLLVSYIIERILIYIF
jgi:cation-transporting ATPase 13A2